jgi:hypothetical protein
MISALELKNKIEDLDKKTSLLKFIIRFGIIPALIAFPLNYVLNPNIDPVVRSSPLLLGFGFFAFTAMFLTFAIGGLIMIHLSIVSYLAYRRFNANSVLMDDFVPRELAKRIDFHIFERLRAKFEPIFEEIKAGLRYEFSQSRKESDKLFMDEYRKVNLELQTERDLRKQEQARNNQLETKITKLESRIEILEKDKSEKDQIINEKTQTQNIEYE